MKSQGTKQTEEEQEKQNIPTVKKGLDILDGVFFEYSRLKLLPSANPLAWRRMLQLFETGLQEIKTARQLAQDRKYQTRK